MIRFNVRHKIGDDLPWRWELLESDGDSLAAGGFTARSQVRTHPGGPVLHDFSTGNGRARLEHEPGVSADDPQRWFVALLVEDSRDWTWRRGEYDLYVWGPDGGQPISAGAWINEPAITERLA